MGRGVYQVPTMSQGVSGHLRASQIFRAMLVGVFLMASQGVSGDLAQNHRWCLVAPPTPSQPRPTLPTAICIYAFLGTTISTFVVGGIVFASRPNNCFEPWKIFFISTEYIVINSRWFTNSRSFVVWIFSRKITQCDGIFLPRSCSKITRIFTKYLINTFHHFYHFLWFRVTIWTRKILTLDVRFCNLARFLLFGWTGRFGLGHPIGGFSFFFPRIQSLNVICFPSMFYLFDHNLTRTKSHF